MVWVENLRLFNLNTYFSRIYLNFKFLRAPELIINVLFNERVCYLFVHKKW